MYNIQYLHITIIYVLLISYISHTPASSLPESGSNFSDLDKLFHFLEFFLLGFLIQQSLVERQIKPKSNLLFNTLILGFSIACIDELHQRYQEIGQLDAILFICQAGGRAYSAAEFMASIGGTEMIVVEGGMSSWSGPRKTDGKIT